MKKAAFYTLGCKVNTYETEGMKRLFETAGYDIVDYSSLADVYVINTCTVTHLSDRKSRQMIRRAKNTNPEAIIAAVGCYAQVAPEDLAAIKGVNLILGSRYKNRIVEYVEGMEPKSQKIVVEKENEIKEYEELWTDNYTGQTRAFLKIQEGCNQFCSYCIIPHARGRIRSRSFVNIIEEAKRLSLNGFKEIVLTGIHLTSYGLDKGDNTLLDVIKGIHQIEGIERIRLGSLEPMYITDSFLDEIGNLPRLCPHFHLSLQSGCNETLKRMNRKYTVQEYGDIVSKLKRILENVAITTDIMVGFPGETESEFNKTVSFVKKMEFAKVHIFKYSPRKGTPAAGFINQVPDDIKESRSKELFKVTGDSQKEFLLKYIGEVIPVLFEQEVSQNKGLYEGLTPNYISVRAYGDENLSGKILNVRVEKQKKDYVIGTLVK